MEDQILQKYKKYKKVRFFVGFFSYVNYTTSILFELKIVSLSFQKFPGYREEKKRCEYLHQKLSHIKGLILDYDRTQSPT